MRYDVIVVGAGLTGMLSMLSFAARGFSVLGLEHQKDKPLDARDLRSTALLMPSIETLEWAGLWPELEAIATPLDVMEIVDAKQAPAKSVRFLASEIGQAHFGHNFLNAKLHHELRARIKAQANITLFFEQSLTQLMNYEGHVAIKTNTDSFEARLLIGADGRHSATRKAAGIGAHLQTLEQMAQVFTVTHERPHENTSTEVHEEGGPFTFVPMHDIEGQHASAVVWMDRPEAIEHRAGLAEAEFNAEINARAHDVRGKLSRTSGLGAFPLANLRVERFAKERVALIGEAAHVVPPIGAQGLNMSVSDMRTLLRVCERGGLENPRYLQSWSASRLRDVRLRQQGIAILNQISIGEMSKSAQLRRWGLNVLEKQSPLKSGLMRLGLGR